MQEKPIIPIYLDVYHYLYQWQDKTIRQRKRYLQSDLTSGGQCTRLKGKRRKPIKKVNALRQKLQLVYNKELSNATRRRYISLFMLFVSQSAL